MKATGTTYWKSPNTGATNSSGFSARGGGYRTYGFRNIRERGVFWTSTPCYSYDYAYVYMMSYDNASLSRFGSSAYDYALYKRYGASVRCVKSNGKESDKGTGIPTHSVKSEEAPQ